MLPSTVSFGVWILQAHGMTHSVHASIYISTNFPPGWKKERAVIDSWECYSVCSTGLPTFQCCCQGILKNVLLKTRQFGIERVLARNTITISLIIMMDEVP